MSDGFILFERPDFELAVILPHQATPLVSPWGCRVSDEKTIDNRFFEACNENKEPKERVNERRAATIFSEGPRKCYVNHRRPKTSNRKIARFSLFYKAFRAFLSVFQMCHFFFPATQALRACYAGCYAKAYLFVLHNLFTNTTKSAIIISRNEVIKLWNENSISLSNHG